MNKRKNINKDNIITISIITILITIALGSTYAYLNITSTNKTNNTTAGCFNVTYTGTTINTNNLTSSTNYTEGAKSTIVISKPTNCKIYDKAKIYIKTSSGITAPINTVNALKYHIASSTNTIIESNETLTNSKDGIITSSPDNPLEIAEVNLTDSEVTYDIYIWIDMDISKGQYNGTQYLGNIYAEASQSSTITS